MLLAAGHHSRHSDLFRRLQSLLGGEPQLLRGRFLKAAVVGKQRLVNDDLCWRRTEKEGERERERANEQQGHSVLYSPSPSIPNDGWGSALARDGRTAPPTPKQSKERVQAPSKAKRERESERERDRIPRRERVRETESQGRLGARRVKLLGSSPDGRKEGRKTDNSCEVLAGVRYL